MKTKILVLMSLLSLTALAQNAEEKDKAPEKKYVQRLGVSLLNNPTSENSGSITSGGTKYSGNLVYEFSTGFDLAYEFSEDKQMAWNNGLQVEYASMKFSKYSANIGSYYFGGSTDGMLTSLSVSYFGKYQANVFYFPVQIGYTLVSTNTSQYDMTKTAKTTSIVGFGIGADINEKLSLEAMIKVYGFEVDSVSISGVTIVPQAGTLRMLSLGAKYSF